ncbi:EAL domain-containing protein [Lacibacterium aquatile]|uniref:EAL domain-containing protein n=1 Tax=Lacibacterium aquatile TaxID=1168082 RepID=A0ABW5DWS6_9PROT
MSMVALEDKMNTERTFWILGVGIVAALIVATQTAAEIFIGPVKAYWSYVGIGMGLSFAALGWFGAKWRKVRQRQTRQDTQGEFVRKVLDEKSYTLLYQPICDINTGAILACEALVRLRQDDGSLSSPYPLLSAAAVSEMGPTVGCAILDQLAVDWRHHRLQLPVTLNLSVRELRNSRLTARLIAHRGLPLNIEVTENAFLDDAGVVERLRMLRALGYKIYLDDFGTGFSSMTHLAEMPIDAVKLDRTLVHRLPESSKHRSISRAIVHMAQGLGLRTVAEGVETMAELAELKAIGCDTVQGYLYAHPMEARELAHRVELGLPLLAA